MITSSPQDDDYDNWEWGHWIDLDNDDLTNGNVRTFSNGPDPSKKMESIVEHNNNSFCKERGGSAETVAVEGAGGSAATLEGTESKLNLSCDKLPCCGCLALLDSNTDCKPNPEFGHNKPIYDTSSKVSKADKIAKYYKYFSYVWCCLPNSILIYYDSIFCTPFLCKKTS
tara:strand:- start:104 stop:613 length:510 start_codon:yes stop_codon:yes gene_type:complete